jgi:hypothetical protein
VESAQIEGGGVESADVAGTSVPEGEGMNATIAAVEEAPASRADDDLVAGSSEEEAHVDAHQGSEDAENS